MEGNEHSTKVYAAVDALIKVWHDKSVSRQTRFESLYELKDRIDNMLDVFHNDDELEERNAEA